MKGKCFINSIAAIIFEMEISGLEFPVPTYFIKHTKLNQRTQLSSLENK